MHTAVWHTSGSWGLDLSHSCKVPRSFAGDSLKTVDRFFFYLLPVNLWESLESLPWIVPFGTSKCWVLLLCPPLWQFLVSLGTGGLVPPTMVWTYLGPKSLQSFLNQTTFAFEIICLNVSFPAGEKLLSCTFSSVIIGMSTDLHPLWGSWAQQAGLPLLWIWSTAGWKIVILNMSVSLTLSWEEAVEAAHVLRLNCWSEEEVRTNNPVLSILPLFCTFVTSWMCVRRVLPVSPVQHWSCFVSFLFQCTSSLQPLHSWPADVFLLSYCFIPTSAHPNADCIWLLVHNCFLFSSSLTLNTL